MIHVSVHYQGMLADRAGCRKELLSLPVGTTAAQLESRVWEMHPSLKGLATGPDGRRLSSILWFVDYRPARMNAALRDGAEVMLVPMATAG